MVLRNKSVYYLIQSVYPEYELLPWKFHDVPAQVWNDDKNKRMFMDWAGKQLGVKEMDHWYSVQIKVTKILGNFSIV